MSIISTPYPDEANRVSRKHPLMPTTDPELRWLCMMAKQSQGNILEIGTHYGLTTRCLATHCPDKLVFTVDYISDSPTMLAEQAHEMPTLTTVGMWARGVPNVLIALQDSKTFDYAGKDIGFIFIDGDHSHDGVKADTQLALKNAEVRAERGKQTVIAWHDFYDHPWVRVKAYIEEMSASLPYPIRHVDGTYIAYVSIP